MRCPLSTWRSTWLHTNRVIGLTALLTSTLVGYSPGALARAPAEALPTGLSRLPQTAAPGTDLDAWAPLGPLVQDALFIGIGEAEHGTRGLAELRGRATAWLVEVAGVRVVAQEDSWFEALELNAQLQACRQTVQPIQRPAGRMWNDGTQPFLDWACRFNAAHPNDPVHVIGTDAQSPWHDMAVLRAAAATLPTPAPLLEALEPLDACHGAGHASKKAYRQWGVENGFPSPKPEHHTRCIAGLKQLDSVLAASEPELEHAGVYWKARLAALGLRTFELQNQRLLVDRAPYAAQDVREPTQLDVLLTLREQVAPNARTVFWAHNEHVRASSVADGPAYTSFGTLLARRTDLPSIAIGTAGFSVATELGPRYDPPTPSKRSVEARLHALGEPALLVDTRGWKGTSTDRRVRLGRHAEEAVVTERFRALLYLDVSEAAVP